MLLGEQPISKTLEMDESYRSRALTGDNHWVVSIMLVTPANAALDLVRIGNKLWEVVDTLDLHGFLKLLLVKFFRAHLRLITPEILDSKAHPANFDGVKFLNFVIILAIFVLKGSGN